MPRSEPEQADQPGKTVAVAAEALYLVNLLLAPGLAFAALLWLWWRNRHDAPPLARNHLHQTLRASIMAGILLVGVNVLAIVFGGYREPATWLVVILYFTICHSSLVLFGMFGLARAMAGRTYVYPLIGGRAGEAGA